MPSLLIAVLGLLGVAILTPIGSVLGNLIVLGAVLGIFYGTLALGGIRNSASDSLESLTGRLLDPVETPAEEK